MDKYVSKVKIDHENPLLKDDNVGKFLGKWYSYNENELAETFQTASPFPHILIPNFLDREFAEELRTQFSDPDDSWFKYHNPIEVKYAKDDNMPSQFNDLTHILSNERVISKMCKMSGIDNLEYDEYLHGAGIHAHPRGGFLNMHLDYEKHPISGKERRLNVILYMVEDEWKKEWKGDTQLWDSEIKKCIGRSYPQFNYAIIFRTNDISWHGLPDPIMCPEGKFRKTFAYYYVSPLESEKDEKDYRYKARFIKRPDDPHDERMEQLYKIRPNRRITKEDMETIWPDWKAEK